MTQLLEEALSEVAKMPPAEQDALAEDKAGLTKPH